jgi:hypothetical protein
MVLLVRFRMMAVEGNRRIRHQLDYFGETSILTL